LRRDSSQPQHIDIPSNRPSSGFQETGIKPNKTGRFALSRGFSGLIYALDTESPRTGMVGEDVFKESPAGRNMGAAKVLVER
jgi:hypothetical protein